eukprot:scaffold106_cov380-Prasinococcus_capsulatus_cf.AAC.44
MVEELLPSKIEIKVPCPLAPCQIFWYKRLLLKNSKTLAALETEAANDPDLKGTVSAANNNEWKKMAHLFVQLRKCCLHPYLFPTGEPDFDGTTGEDIVTASGKMQVLDKLLEKLKKNGNRVIIFSQFTQMLDIIQDYCSLRDYKVARLDGSISRVQRWVDIGEFNRNGSETFIFLLSTRAGGLGVNLQTADTVILFDSDWNPQVDRQAMARAHRIGQTKMVHVYRLVSKGTVEERIIQRAERKLYLDDAVNKGDVQTHELEGMSKSQLFLTVAFGASQIMSSTDTAGSTIGLPSDEEVAKLIDRSSAPTDVFASEQTSVDKEMHNTRVFQGIDYGPTRGPAKHIMEDIDGEWKALKKRERKSTTISVDGYTVFKKNNYAMETGELSVFQNEISGRTQKQTPRSLPQKPQTQRAGIDYKHQEYCQACWDGGLLVCCDGCPLAFHATCLNPSCAPPAHGLWRCPHHACVECGKKAADAGGLLFRCENCFRAFCEDHLPSENEILGRSERFEELGQVHPKQACYIYCSRDCMDFAKESTRIFRETQAAREEEERREELRQQERRRLHEKAMQEKRKAEESKAMMLRLQKGPSVVYRDPSPFPALRLQGETMADVQQRKLAHAKEYEAKAKVCNYMETLRQIERLEETQRMKTEAYKHRPLLPKPCNSVPLFPNPVPVRIGHRALAPGLPPQVGGIAQLPLLPLHFQGYGPVVSAAVRSHIPPASQPSTPQPLAQEGTPGASGLPSPSIPPGLLPPACSKVNYSNQPRKLSQGNGE